MKNMFNRLSLILIILFFSSCNKEDSSPTTPANKAPNQPVIVSPPNGATDQIVPLNLQWICVDPENDQLSYNVYLGTTNPPVAEVSIEQSSTNYQISTLAPNTKYYWKIVAKDKSLSTSGPVWNFTTIAVGAAPPAPTLSSPANNATSLIIPPLLIWNASTGAASYTLQVSTSSSFTNFEYNQSGLTGTSQQISGLSNNTKYYWRVNATNSVGTSGWSNGSSPWNFTTVVGSSCAGVPTVPYSGKTYHTVQIGNQCWLKENLDVGVYVASTNTGATHSDVSNNGIIEKYCFDNNPANCNTYGGLYDWNEAMGYVTTPGAQGICPPGWHIPTLAEFEALKAAVNNDGNALKSVGQGTGAGAGTNSSGFSALLSGGRDFKGYFINLGYFTLFWSSTEIYSNYANLLSLYYDDSTIGLYNYNKEFGFSVRCVKD